MFAFSFSKVLATVKQGKTMTTAFFMVFLLLQLKSVASLDPCVDYTPIWIGYGYRSSNFNSQYTDISICDEDMDKDTWYRFDFDAGTQLIETAVPVWFCGTQAPIWMNGTHPTSDSQVSRQVCATTPDSDCGWTGNISVRLCNTFYVYQLAVPGGCALAYCVDAATQKQCQPPLIWIEDEFQCGANVTKPPTIAPSSTTPKTTQITTSTLPPDSDWTFWGSWSSCSKPCDYGVQSRKRTCLNLPCAGSASEVQLCNTYNCKELDEEKTKGIILELISPSPQNTMLTVVENENRINELMRKRINSICSANASVCCGVNIDRDPPYGTIYVASSDIYSPQGYPKQISDTLVDDKVISVINDDTYQKVCQGTSSSRIVVRQSEPATKKYISFDVMAMAATDCSDRIYQETGLKMNSYKDPAKIEDSENCPTTTCVIPIVIGCVIGIVGVICLVVVVYKCCNKPNRVHSPPPYSPRKDTELPETNVPGYSTIGLPVYVEIEPNQGGLTPVYQEK